MPQSQQPKGGEELIVARLSKLPKDTMVIDIGAGEGKWGLILNELGLSVDGIEVWAPYVEKYDLKNKYNKLFNLNAVAFTCYEQYDIAIMGDVLEHIEHDEAVAFVKRISKVLDIYLTIPISTCVQDGSFYGNPFESHVYQWTNEELSLLGFEQLHVGTNPNGLVKIGTYFMPKATE